jgi:hypothetical protein
MAVLKFNADEVRKLVAHSKGREHPNELYGQPLDMKEFLYLVHDSGVYLMSGAKERLPNPDSKIPESSLVAYAQGCNPKTDEDCYETSRCLVGGDDFGEPVGLDALEGVLRQQGKTLVMTLSQRSMKIRLAR